jgi:hypothetical protein
VAEWITGYVPKDVEPQHREKFISDVLAEVENLDASWIGGLGITPQELEVWRGLRRQGVRSLNFYRQRCRRIIRAPGNSLLRELELRGIVKESADTPRPHAATGIV